VSVVDAAREENVQKQRLMTPLLIFHFVNFTRAAGQIAYTCAFFIWSRTALFFAQRTRASEKSRKQRLKNRKGVKNGRIAHPSRLAQQDYGPRASLADRGRPASLDAQPQPSCG